MLGYYDKLSSEVYQLDKYIGLSFGDVEFYIERLAACKGNILEPGVGTGRILIPLLERGLNVEGFDVSKDMLQICRANCERRGLDPTLFEGEMQSFSVAKEFEAIIIPAGTFLLLHERADSSKALKNFYKHLLDGGKLIVDLFLPTDFTMGKVSTRTWKVSDGGVITLESQIVEVNEIHQYTVSHHRYEKWKAGKLLQTKLERFPLRWYGVEEFKMILEQIAFRDIVISTDYEYGRYPENASQTITFEAIANKS